MLKRETTLSIHSNNSFISASFHSTAAVTIMGYTTQAPPSPAWSVQLCFGRNKMFANGWRNTVLTTTWPTWRCSPTTPSQVSVYSVNTFTKSSVRVRSLKVCLHRPSTAASQWGEAGEDGPGAGDVQTGAAATGAAAPGTGGRTQPAAAQQRYGWVCVCVCVRSCCSLPNLASWHTVQIFTVRFGLRFLRLIALPRLTQCS